MSDASLTVEFDTNAAITVGTIMNTEMLDGTNVAAFGEQSLDYVQEHPGLNLLINFENIRYMSSAGLTELLRIREALMPNNGAVQLWGVNKDIANVFRITNLDKIFKIHNDESLDQACTCFSQSVQPESGN